MGESKAGLTEDLGRAHKGADRPRATPFSRGSEDGRDAAERMEVGRGSQHPAKGGTGPEVEMRETGPPGIAASGDAAVACVAGAHTLKVLEFEQALDDIALLASSAPGRRVVGTLRPAGDRALIERELERVEETMDFLEERPAWSVPEIPDVGRALSVLRVEGTTLRGKELYRLGVLMASGEALSDALSSLRGGDSEAGDGFHLLEVRERVYRNPECVRRILRSTDAGGSLLDGASRELGRLRTRLRRARRKIVRRLQSYLESLPRDYVVADASVTIRGDRYVVPIRREGRREVGGVVRDESGSGATLFVEPPIASELMNELRDLEWDEAREARRILSGFTEEIRPRMAELEESGRALVDFDTLYARARFAMRWEGVPPVLLPAGRGELELVRARHPLLLGGAEEVVPFDLALEPDERALVVSGPNAGGKSVFLKAMGLISALTQSGVICPVGAGSRLPVFQRIFADIGDEQSIAENLSTFSAHLANLRTIAEEAGPGSLVLIDEMGRGTDPGEGAALARAVLERLVSAGAVTICTSHLGALKRLDTPGSGILNTSLHFDLDRMEPTYHLVKGRPGRSYGLAMARRLGLPEEILECAEAHLDSGEARIDDLLETLEGKEGEARRLVESLAAEREGVRHLSGELRAREMELAKREAAAADRAGEEARQMLLEARLEVEEAIREVRTAAAEEREEASHRARSQVEEAVRRFARGSGEDRPRDPSSAPLGEGAKVRIGESRTMGRVVEMRQDRAIVDVSGVRVEVSLAKLVPVPGEPSRKEARPNRSGASGMGVWKGPDVAASNEIHLRGLRVDAVDGELLRALDRAILAGLPELRVVHGKGTGALRKRVEEILGRDPRIERFRIGNPGEGGGGVTVVRLP